MEDLKNLLGKISVLQILAHFGFQVVENKTFYLIYSSTINDFSYYIFLDEQRITRVFTPRNFSLIDKHELFLDLVDLKSIEDIDIIIGHIKDQSVPDGSTSLPSIESFSFLTRLAALKKVTQSEFDLAASPQFHKRVFQTTNGALSIPLYEFRSGQEKSDRVLNFVHVKNRCAKYFNNSRNWLTTTCYDPENRFLILTSNPNFWLEHLSATYGPDYFMILCHPEPDEEVFQSILSIMNRMGFSDLFLVEPITSADRHLLANITTLTLNSYVENLVFKIYYENRTYSVTTYSVEGSDHADFMHQLIDEVNQRVCDVLVQGSHGQSRQVSEIINAFLVLGSSRQQAGKDVFTASVPAHAVVAKEFFCLITKKFGIEKRMKILEF
jgi:hypothetical protein